MDPHTIILHVDYTFDDLKELSTAHAKRERKQQRWVFAAFAAIVAAMIILRGFFSAAQPASAPVGPPPSLDAALRDLLLSVLPWLIAIIALISVLLLYLRSVYKRAYAEKNPLQRHHVIELSPQRVVTTEPIARHEYQWDAFVRWVESENLLLLYLSYNLMLPIPKRSFPSPQQLEQCRALLRAMIDSPATARQAFPLVPSAQPVLPIPPLQPPPLPIASRAEGPR
jgi:hypothetical protein